MKVPRSISSFPEQTNYLSIRDVRFGVNGPYSLRCCAGEVVCLTGASGIGKTRLLRALADLERYNGEVKLSTHNCADLPAPEWRRKVALIPAESRWWFSEVKPHMGNRYSDAELLQLLTELGFENDVLGWRVSRLSTGEKQRLSVARVLTRKPEALLLDELGSSLDIDNSTLLESVIISYQKTHHTPVLWVSHDKAQIDRIADRLIVMYQDRLEQQSTSEQNQ